MEKIFIDAGQAPIGRIGSYAAKQALLGNKIFVLNCEKAVISGNKKTTVKKVQERRRKGGSALKGPYHSKDSEKIVKRAIRGMLPDYKRGRGREAWKNIICYQDIPNEYKDEKMIKLNKRFIKKISLRKLKQKI